MIMIFKSILEILLELFIFFEYNNFIEILLNVRQNYTENICI